MNLSMKIGILTVVLLLVTLFASSGMLVQARDPGVPAIGIPNPLGDVRDIGGVLERIASFLFIIATPILTIMVLWSGFLFLTSAGVPAKLVQAKQALLWAILGFAIVLINWGFAHIIAEILGAGRPR